MAEHKRSRSSIPPTRKAMRRRDRLQRRVALVLLAGLFASGGVLALTMGTSPAAYGAARPFDQDTATTVTGAASRSGGRETGSWTLGESIDPARLSGRAASNPQVAQLVNHRDRDAYPAGLDPDHATGDTGNAYAFSQCTWWAYKRRHQLGLPAGSHMGDGKDWAASARKLGYWVDSTPRVGDVMVFRAGQDGSSPIHGHVAIVEAVNADGSIDTSECGAAYNGKPFTRRFTAAQAAQHEYVHY